MIFYYNRRTALWHKTIKLFLIYYFLKKELKPEQTGCVHNAYKIYISLCTELHLHALLLYRRNACSDAAAILTLLKVIFVLFCSADLIATSSFKVRYYVSPHNCSLFVVVLRGSFFNIVQPNTYLECILNKPPTLVIRSRWI